MSISVGTGITYEIGSFLLLTDTPTSYAGQTGKFPKVNAGETGLEFAAIAGGGDALVANPLSQFAASGGGAGGAGGTGSIGDLNTKGQGGIVGSTTDGFGGAGGCSFFGGGGRGTVAGGGEAGGNYGSGGGGGGGGSNGGGAGTAGVIFITEFCNA